MIKVSVIVTTFNRARLLKKTIKSVLAQSYEDIELIVVDDCSTDNTSKVVKGFNDPRITYIKRGKNFGNDSRPKNEGIKIAKGEYICFLDDDDIYRKDAIKILHNYIAETRSDVVYGDYLMHHKGNAGPGWSLDFKASTLSRMNFIAMPVVIVKRSALLEIGGFDEKVPKFKDWNLWLRLHKRGFSFMHVSIIVVDVYSQEDSISTKFKTKKNEGGENLPTYFDPADCKIYPDDTFLGKAKPLKVAIFTLNWDRLEYTKDMVQSMKKTAGYPFDYFVVDQGSAQETIDWLETQKWIKAIKYNKKNSGIAKGWNEAIDLVRKTGEYDIVIKLDNDAEMITKNWLALMIEIFERSRKVVLSPYVEGLEATPGGVLRQRETGESPYVQINDRVLGVVPFLGGICWAAPMELYKHYRFPEDVQLAGNKDFMISKYAASQGYALFYLEEARLAHVDGTKGQMQKYPDYFKKSLKAQRTK